VLLTALAAQSAANALVILSSTRGRQP